MYHVCSTGDVVDVTFLNRLFFKQDLFPSLFHRSLDPPTSSLRLPRVLLTHLQREHTSFVPKQNNDLPKQTNLRWRHDGFSLAGEAKGTKEQTRMAKDGAFRDFGKAKENVRGLWTSKI
jgi:hypothetical protein